MSDKNRDPMSTATALVLYSAVTEIETALEAIKTGRVFDGVRQIRDALARLKGLLPVFGAAIDGAQRDQKER